MRCDMTIPVGEPDANGWRTWQCSRPGCGRKTNPTPHTGDRIRFACNGWPRWWELGYLVEFALGVVGIDQEGFNRLRRLCGFTTPCKCPARIATLNASGGWLRDRLAVLASLWRMLIGPRGDCSPVDGN